MQARRRGYRHRESAPPERGHPLANLTRSMSQPAHEPAPAPSLRHIPRRYLALGLIIAAICLLGTLVLVRDNSGPTSSSTVETFNPAPSSLVASVAAVPASVYDAVGVTSPANPVTPPQPAAAPGSPLWRATANGEPVVFFYGAEFAPYAAAERWPLILALSRFGTFNQLGVMQSSSTTAFANLSTFTFWNVSYTQPLGRPPGGGALQLVEPDGRAVSRTREARRPAVRRHRHATGRARRPSRSWTWRTATSSAAPPSLPASWPVSHRTRSPGTSPCAASPLTQAVVSAANEITAAICSVDGNRPATVCESRGVLAADDALKITRPH